jgi:hypothetical protein
MGFGDAFGDGEPETRAAAVGGPAALAAPPAGLEHVRQVAGRNAATPVGDHHGRPPVRLAHHDVDLTPGRRVPEPIRHQVGDGARDFRRVHPDGRRLRGLPGQPDAGADGDRPGLLEHPRDQLAQGRVVDTTAEVNAALSSGDAVDQGVVKYFVCTVNKVPAGK